MRKIIYILSLIIGLASCTVKQNIHFNKDFSGMASYAIDFSAVTAMIGSDSLESLESTGMMDGLKDLKTTFENIDGISNFGYEMNIADGYMKISFDFEDTDALTETFKNKELNKDNPTGDVPQTYHGKGRKLIMELGAPELDSLDSEAQSMMHMMQFDFTYSFDRKIKKVKCEEIEFIKSEDGKSLNRKGDFAGLFEVGQELRKCTIILKK